MEQEQRNERVLKPVTVDERCQIRTPHHDGTLCGIFFDERKCWLHYRSFEGDPGVLLLKNVSAMDLTGLRQSNDILSMNVIPLSQAERFVDRTTLGRIEHQWRNASDDTVVFLLDSSYGGEVIALCTAVLGT